MKTQVDARGLSCPQPVLLAIRAMEQQGPIEILVDNEASRENVSRAARARGWSVAAHELDGDQWRLELTR